MSDQSERTTQGSAAVSTHGTSDPRTQPSDTAARRDALLNEVAEARRLYVDRMVNAKINDRRGECSNAEITEWENDAHRRWREKFPTLSGFLIPHGEFR